MSTTDALRSNKFLNKLQELADKYDISITVEIENSKDRFVKIKDKELGIVFGSKVKTTAHTLNQKEYS